MIYLFAAVAAAIVFCVGVMVGALLTRDSKSRVQCRQVSASEAKPD